MCLCPVRVSVCQSFTRQIEQPLKPIHYVCLSVSVCVCLEFFILNFNRLKRKMSVCPQVGGYTETSTPLDRDIFPFSRETPLPTVLISSGDQSVRILLECLLVSECICLGFYLARFDLHLQCKGPITTI